MARIDNVQRILVDEFPEEDRETISKLANILNYFMTQTVDVVNGRLDYDNINKSIITIDITVNANGTPLQPTSFNAEAGVIGHDVINARNLTNSAIYPLAKPFVSFSAQQNGLYRINNITGLQPNNKYQLTIEVTY